jgi:xanthosine utilization system XapX-like protein
VNTVQKIVYAVLALCAVATFALWCVLQPFLEFPIRDIALIGLWGVLLGASFYEVRRYAHKRTRSFAYESSQAQPDMQS